MRAQLLEVEAAREALDAELSANLREQRRDLQVSGGAPSGCWVAGGARGRARAALSARLQGESQHVNRGAPSLLPPGRTAWIRPAARWTRPRWRRGAAS